MKRTDLLSLEIDVQRINISSTDPEEVKFFEELLEQKFDEKELFDQKIKNGTYTVSYKISYQHPGERFNLYIMDIEWWLFSIALQRSWSPFSRVGSFTRIDE